MGKLVKGLFQYITLLTMFLMAIIAFVTALCMYATEYPPAAYLIAFVVSGIFFIGGAAVSGIDKPVKPAIKSIAPISPASNKKTSFQSDSCMEALPVVDNNHPVNHDPSDDQCPYCGEAMDWKKKPSRRSQFACKHCGEIVNHETTPLLYTGSYLTDDQLELDGIAHQLHHWCFTGITETTIPNTRRKLKKSGIDPVPTTIVCSLLIQAMEYVEKQKENAIKRIKSEFRSDPQFVKEMVRDEQRDAFEIDDINGLMKEYCEFIEALAKQP